MATEVEEKYPLENGLPQYRVLDAVNEFRKKYERYPAKVILNPKYKDIGSKSFIPFPTNHAPAIKPLELKDIDDAPMAQGYHIPMNMMNRSMKRLSYAEGLLPYKDFALFRMLYQWTY